LVTTVLLVVAVIPAARAQGAVTGTITSFAGGGGAPAGYSYSGFAGDGGPAATARLFGPQGLAVDAAGDLLIADSFNRRVRKVDPAGVITTIAGTGGSDSTGDGGPATSASLNPTDVVADPAGDVFVAECANQRVRKIDPAGTITTIAGFTAVQGFSGDGGPATSAHFFCPIAIALDGHGRLLIADSTNNRIRAVDLTQATPTITTVAGSGSSTFSGDGGPATAAGIHLPTGIAVEPAGDILIAEWGSNRVRKVSPGGTITTLAGRTQSSFAVNDGDGGPATSAGLLVVNGVAVGHDGSVYITSNCLLRRVAPDGTISTIAGHARPGDGVECGYGPFGCQATAAQFGAMQPSGNTMAVDAAGDIFLSDGSAHQVYRVEPLTVPPASCFPAAKPPPAPAAPTTPAAPAAPTPVVTGRPAASSLPVAKPPTPSAGQVFVLPSAKRCVSRRRFTIHVRKVAGITWAGAVIKIDHRRVKTIARKRIGAVVNLRSLPKGTFALSITATSTDGRKVTGTRTYHTCAAKRRVGRPPKL
jgi:pyruvate/2-oxoglutarate dehydrogenase complex dihydrolipoamide acyltransferase (E2) component